MKKKRKALDDNANTDHSAVFIVNTLKNSTKAEINIPKVHIVTRDSAPTCHSRFI